jgi:acid phosphatase
MYISPNILNDGREQVSDFTNITSGHNTNVTYAANWTRSFMTEVLGNPKFNNNTCVLITFDENEDYPQENRVFSLLLGDAISGDLRGTNDSTFYTHYSQLSTIQVLFLDSYH